MYALSNVHGISPVVVCNCLAQNYSIEPLLILGYAPSENNIQLVHDLPGAGDILGIAHLERADHNL